MRRRQLGLHAVQCPHMALTRHKNAFRRSLPAHHLQQLVTQALQTHAGFGGNQHITRRLLRRDAGHIRLVPDVDDGRIFWQFLGQCACHTGVVSYVIHSILPGQVVQEKHRIGAFNLAPGALHTDFFDLIERFAQAGRIDHMQRNAFNLDQLRDLVARGAGNRGDDGQFGARQRIEQRALADIGLPGNHHLDAFTQDGALRGALHHAGQRGLQAQQLAAGIGLLQKVDVFFGEIQRRFDQHAQMDQLRQQRIDGLREFARHGARRRARRRLSAGVDQVGNGFGLGQIDLVVQKCPLCELSRLGDPQLGQARHAGERIERSACFQAAGQQQLQNDRAAMRLQLQHVFARIGMRRRKINRQALVNHLTLRITKGQVAGLAGGQAAAADGGDHWRNVLAGNAHNTDRSAARRRRNGNNRVVMTGQHGKAPYERKGRLAALWVI